MIDFANQLNGEQLAAVQADDGPVLIIAAAGTGKTRTLTYRVAWLVEQEVPAERILLLTFTNKAAHEMLERAQELVGDRVGGMWGGTFHHMANRILRRHATALGFGLDFTILDQDDARGQVKASMEGLGLKGKDFPKPDVLLSIFGLASGKDVSVESVAEERFGEFENRVMNVARVHSDYQERKRTLNAMDFDDLLANGLKLFEEHPEIAATYQERFKYVMVDEYQDTNQIQTRWVDLVAKKHRNLLVVGDDFQSIYSWRGADFRNILNFPERYPDAQVFKLETNYRSVPEILSLANASIEGNPEQFQKTLRAVRENYQRPCLIEVMNGEDQARYIIRQIANLRREGYPMKDIVVLYRAHYQAMELQMALAREGLPYLITSGVRFFEQAHVKDVSCLLRVLVTPGDQIAFLRLLGMLPRVGAKTCLKIWEKIGGSFDAADPYKRKLLLDALPAVARPVWQRIEPVVERYFSEGMSDEPGEVVHRFVEAFYGQYATDTFENHTHRLDDIGEMIIFASRFDSANDFLNEVSLLTNLDTAGNTGGNSDLESIRLSTIHQAKGLEWSVVFVLWLADGMFPSARSMTEDGGEEEERRLFYVTITRAKDELFLCYPSSRRARDGSTTYFPVSRFLKELPGNLLRRGGY